NDGDHAGERERLTYLLDGSDTGWRINWQYGKYTDPNNNTYKVWMDEKMALPRNDEQAAYFLPAIQNFVNGPTGLVYNPGTALSPDYYDHFFVAEFRGSPSRSQIHAFKMKPDGAGFALDSTHIIAKQILPTGLDFGPEGALYYGDWINGWGTKDEGRIWKLDRGAAAGAELGIRNEVEKLITTDFKEVSKEQLLALLGHQDQRIRRKAQFFLAENIPGAFGDFQQVAANAESPQLARIHALWGMAQMIRRGYEDGNDAFAIFLRDKDSEIVAQAAKMIGDLKITSAFPALIERLRNSDPRVRFFAMEALGRTQEPTAVGPIVEMLRANDGQDAWLRHGGMIALGRIGDEMAMRELSADPSRNIRLIAVVALRRMESEQVKAFLMDEDEYVVAEAARAINDDYTIPGAMSPLAQILNTRVWTSEPLIRRIINANLNIGNQRTVDNLIAYANNTANPATMRAEALATLAHWDDPSLFDRVDGRYRGQRKKDATYVKAQLGKELSALLASKEAPVQRAAIGVAAGLGITEVTEQMIGLLRSAKAPATR
ncbi:MAG: HEAT repeat domain-containing protein, partial [Bacteroidota bacterium]